MSAAHEEVIRVLETVGHHEAAEQIREELKLESNDDTTIKFSRNALIYILSKIFEQETCSRAYFPCNVCINEARKIMPIVVKLMEKTIIHTFVNVTSKNDLQTTMISAFKYAIQSVKKKLFESNNILFQNTHDIAQLNSRVGKELSPITSYPKIIKISKEEND